MHEAKNMNDLKTYNSWLIADFLAFAIKNYEFPNNLGVPAIETFERIIRMSEEMSLGIRVGKALPTILTQRKYPCSCLAHNSR